VGIASAGLSLTLRSLAVRARAVLPPVDHGPISPIAQGAANYSVGAISSAEATTLFGTYTASSAPAAVHAAPVGSGFSAQA
jgi:hypothetical protein